MGYAWICKLRLLVGKYNSCRVRYCAFIEVVSQRLDFATEVDSSCTYQDPDHRWCPEYHGSFSIWALENGQNQQFACGSTGTAGACWEYRRLRAI